MASANFWAQIQNEKKRMGNACLLFQGTREPFSALSF